MFLCSIDGFSLTYSLKQNIGIHGAFSVLGSTGRRRRLKRRRVCSSVAKRFSSCPRLRLTSFVRNATDANEIGLMRTGRVYLHGNKFREIRVTTIRRYV